MGIQSNPRLVNIYGVYENGEKLFQGDAHEVAEYCSAHVNSIYACYNRGNLLGYRYLIKKEGAMKPEETPTKPRPLTEEEKKVKYYTEHLNRYGNTIVRLEDNPKKIIRWLKDLGYDCEMKTYNHYIGDEDIFSEGTRIGYAHLEQDNILRWKDYDKQRV